MTAEAPPGSAFGRAFERRFAALAAIGRDPSTGACHRSSWITGDRAARAWFTTEATNLGLLVEVDRLGNMWAFTPGLRADLVAWDTDHEGAFAWAWGLSPRTFWHEAHTRA